MNTTSNKKNQFIILHILFSVNDHWSIINRTVSYLWIYIAPLQHNYYSEVLSAWKPQRKRNAFKEWEADREKWVVSLALSDGGRSFLVEGHTTLTEEAPTIIPLEQFSD